jgi:hypothetical protein
MQRYFAVFRAPSGSIVRREFDAWPSTADASEAFAQFPQFARHYVLVSMGAL